LYEYVPLTVSVTLNRSWVQVLLLGLGLGEMVAPLGIEKKSMLWMLAVSLLMNTMVVPGEIVTFGGSKFSDWFAPTPLGRMISNIGLDGAVDVELEHVEVELELEVEVEVVVVVEFIS
jgi:hypothetical protein